MPTVAVPDVAEHAAATARDLGLGRDESEGTDHLRDPLLASGPTFEPGSVRQDDVDLDSIMSTARATNAHYMALVQGIADKTGAEAKLAPIKGLGRIKQKIMEDYKVDGARVGDASKITDAVRGSLVYDTIEDAMAGLSSIELMAKKKNVKSVRGIPKKKDRFAKGGTGYKDINILIELGNGFLCELQLHVRAIIEAKGAAGHHIYDVIRVMEKMDLNAEQQADFDVMDGFQNDVYALAEERAAAGEGISDADKESWATDPRMALVDRYRAELKLG